MADKDWYDWRLPADWRATARGMERGESPGRTSDRALRALTHTLRRGGGLPGLSGMLDAVGAHARGMSVPDAFEAVRKLRLREGEPDLAQIAERAAFAAIAEREHRRTDGDARHEMGKQLARCAMDHYLGPVLLHLTGTRFKSPQDAREYQRECLGLMEKRASHIFEKLLSDPSASRLRSPARTIRKEGTAALLQEGVTRP